MDPVDHQPVRAIESPEALQALVRDCAAGGTPIAAYGTTYPHYGAPPRPEAVRIELRSSLIEHSERDFTVRVWAGVTAGEVRHALSSSGQFLPIDVDDEVTIGDVISHGMSGELRVGYGSVRELLLGMKLVDGQGRDIHVGGRTVKNVAGLDVTRLMVGSAGELGIVYEATLRTAARPRHVGGVTLEVASPRSLDGQLTRLLTSDAAPARLAMSLEGGAWRLHVGYHGTPDSCEAQVAALRNLTREISGVSIANSRFVDLDRDLTALAARRRWQAGVGTLVRVIVPPGRACAAAESLAAQLPSAGDWGIQVLPVYGTILLGTNSSDGERLDRIARAIADEVHGRRVLLRPPTGHPTQPPIHPVPVEQPLIARLKRVFDPHGVLNPCRTIQMEAVAS